MGPISGTLTILVLMEELLVFDIKLEGALDRATGQGVTVGVVDDGLSIDHADLAANATGPHLNLLEGDPSDPNDV